MHLDFFCISLFHYIPHKMVKSCQSSIAQVFLTRPVLLLSLQRPTLSACMMPAERESTGSELLPSFGSH